MPGSIKINQERCKGCLFCIEHCPKKAISLSGILNMKGYFVAEFHTDNGCTGCGTCALVCPDVAIEVYKT
jgi:2-oxoglutarate ferredoxin oxidoreductase subunit delta